MDENNASIRKKIILRMGIAMFFALLMLTFFSSTIQSFGVAGVVAGRAEVSTVMRSFRSDGVLGFEEEIIIHAGADGVISYHVLPGSSAQAGDLLFVVTADMYVLEQRLAEIKQRRVRLNMSIEQTESDLEFAEDRLSRAGSAAERSLHEQQISHINNSLLLLNIEFDEVSRLIDERETFIESGGVTEVHAPYDMAILDFRGVTSGVFVNRNTSVVRGGLTQGNLTTTVIFHDSILDVTQGGIFSMRIDIPSMNAFGLSGTITRSMPYRNRWQKDLTFSAPRANVNGGERVRVSIDHITEVQENVLPNSAVRQDGRGYFILYVEWMNSRFVGGNYYARRLDVAVLNRGDRVTAVNMEAHGIGPIILQSDIPVFDGDRVRLVAER